MAHISDDQELADAPWTDGGACVPILRVYATPGDIASYMKAFKARVNDLNPVNKQRLADSIHEALNASTLTTDHLHNLIENPYVRRTFSQLETVRIEMTNAHRAKNANMADTIREDAANHTQNMTVAAPAGPGAHGDNSQAGSVPAALPDGVILPNPTTTSRKRPRVANSTENAPAAGNIPGGYHLVISYPNGPMYIPITAEEQSMLATVPAAHRPVLLQSIRTQAAGQTGPHPAYHPAMQRAMPDYGMAPPQAPPQAPFLPHSQMMPHQGYMGPHMGPHVGMSGGMFPQYVPMAPYASRQPMHPPPGQPMFNYHGAHPNAPNNPRMQQQWPMHQQRQPTGYYSNMPGKRPAPDAAQQQPAKRARMEPQQQPQMTEQTSNVPQIAMSADVQEMGPPVPMANVAGSHHAGIAQQTGVPPATGFPRAPISSPAMYNATIPAPMSKMPRIGTFPPHQPHRSQQHVSGPVDQQNNAFHAQHHGPHQPGPRSQFLAAYAQQGAQDPFMANAPMNSNERASAAMDTAPKKPPRAEPASRRSKASGRAERKRRNSKEKTGEDAASAVKTTTPGRASITPSMSTAEETPSTVKTPMTRCTSMTSCMSAINTPAVYAGTPDTPPVHVGITDTPAVHTGTTDTAAVYAGTSDTPAACLGPTDTSAVQVGTANTPNAGAPIATYVDPRVLSLTNQDEEEIANSFKIPAEPLNSNVDNAHTVDGLNLETPNSNTPPYEFGSVSDKLEGFPLNTEETYGGLTGAEFMTALQHEIHGSYGLEGDENIGEFNPAELDFDDIFGENENILEEAVRNSLPQPVDEPVPEAAGNASAETAELGGEAEEVEPSGETEDLTATNDSNNRIDPATLGSTSNESTQEAAKSIKDTVENGANESNALEPKEQSTHLDSEQDENTTEAQDLPGEAETHDNENDGTNTHQAVEISNESEQTNKVASTSQNASAAMMVPPTGPATANEENVPEAAPLDAWSMLQPMVRHNCKVYDRSNVTNETELGQNVVALYEHLQNQGAEIRFNDVDRTIFKAPITMVPEQFRFISSTTVFEDGSIFHNEPVGMTEFAVTGKVIADGPAGLNDTDLVEYRNIWRDFKPSVIDRAGAEAQESINLHVGAECALPSDYVSTVCNVNAGTSTASVSDPIDRALQREHENLLDALWSNPSDQLQQEPDKALVSLIPEDLTDKAARSKLSFTDIVRLVRLPDIFERIPDGVDAHEARKVKRPTPEVRLQSKVLAIIGMQLQRSSHSFDSALLSTFRRLVPHFDEANWTLLDVARARMDLLRGEHGIKFAWIIENLVQFDPRAAKLRDMLDDNDERLFAAEREDDEDLLGLMLALEEMLRLAGEALLRPEPAGPRKRPAGEGQPPAAKRAKV